MKVVISEEQFNYILTENRKDTLINKYKDRLNLYGIERVLGDPFIVKTNYKYGDMLLKTLATKHRSDEIKTIFEYLKKFDQIQKNLEKKDINQYEDFHELRTSIDDYLNRKKNVNVEVKKIYEDNDFLVIKPLNFDASCKYGAGTMWCTTNKDNPQHFENYTSFGQSLYYIMFKPLKYGNRMYKIAIHFGTDGKFKYFDALDKELSKDSIGTLKDIKPNFNTLLSAIKEDSSETNLFNLIGRFFDGFEQQLFSFNIFNTYGFRFMIYDTVYDDTKVKMKIAVFSATYDNLIQKFWFDGTIVDPDEYFGTQNAFEEDIMIVGKFLRDEDSEDILMLSNEPIILKFKDLNSWASLSSQFDSEFENQLKKIISRKIGTYTPQVLSLFRIN